MKNRELKKDLIVSGRMKEYRAIRRANAEMGTYFDLNRFIENEILCNALFDMTPMEVVECERIRKNTYQQIKKIHDHLCFLCDGNWDLFFMTFTFNDKTLETTTRKTRRDRISRLLNDFSEDYILNIDYGEKNEREHFHAIVCISDSKNKSYPIEKKGYVNFPYFDDKYKYGYYSAELCRITPDDKKRLSGYISKLTLHSIKISQSYVSVKKGSPYQQYKKLYESYKREQRSDRLFKMGPEGFDERETDLLMGLTD